jgi:hypothetical protein
MGGDSWVSMMLMHGQRSWNTRKESIRKGLTRQNQETTIKKTFLLSFDAESSREREREREHRCERERASERENLLGRMSITGERHSEEEEEEEEEEEYKELSRDAQKSSMR